MNKKKKWIITAIILAVFCAALGIYNYYANRSTNEEEVTRTVSPRSKNILNVNGVIIRPQPLTDGITTVGNLLPDEEVDLSFETSGRLETFAVGNVPVILFFHKITLKNQ